jgi:hypothetical protein
MQGIFINGRRPASKKAVREAIAADQNAVRIEATSMFGNEREGSIADLIAAGFVGRIDFVGPCPFTSRKFYGNLHFSPGKVVVK